MRSSRLAVAILPLTMVASCGGTLPPITTKKAGPRPAPAVVRSASFRLMPQFGHSQTVASLDVSADGKLVASAGGKAVHLWDVASGLRVRTFVIDDGSFEAVRFSGDRHLVTDGSKSLVVWDIDSGQVVRTLATHAEMPLEAQLRTQSGAKAVTRSIALTGDGGVVSGGYEGLSIYELATGKRRLEIRVDQPLFAVAVRNRATVIGAGARGSVYEWRLADGAQIRTFRGHDEDVYTAAVSPDDRILLTTSADGTARVWDLALADAALLGMEGMLGTDGVPIMDIVDARHVLSGHDGGPVGGGAILGGAKLSAATSGADGSVKIWSIETGAVIGDSHTGGPWLDTLTASPDGSLLFSGGADNAVRVWLPNGAMAGVLGQRQLAVSDAAISSDGRRAATGARREVRVWDLATARQLSTWSIGDNIEGLAFTSDGLVIAGAYDDEAVRLWDPVAGKAVAQLGGHSGGVETLAVDGDRLFVSTHDNAIVEWELRGRERLRSYQGLASSAAAIAASVAGRRLAAAGRDRKIVLWSLESGAMIGSIDNAHADFIPSLAMTADGTRLASASDDGTVKIWRLPSLELERKVEAPGGAWCVAFDRAGKRLGFGSGSSVRVLELDAGVERSWAGHADTVFDCAWSKQGGLLTASLDGTARIWKGPSGSSVVLAASDEEWVIYSDQGWFDASRGGVHLVGVIDEGRAYRIDQFAAYLNRPDHLLEQLGLADAALVAHFRKRHAYRLTKLGLADEPPNFASAPRTRIAAAEQDGRFVDLQVDVTTDSGALKSYQIFINDVPLLGTSGAPLTGKKQRVSRRVELNGGVNKIEVSATSVSGAESMRDTRVFRTEDALGDLYVLAFGVSRYKNPKLDLGYAAKDALDVAELLRGKAARGFARVHVKTYVNDEVTRNSIARSAGFLKKSAVNDTVVVFIGGHGVHTRDEAAEYFFVTHDTDPKRLRETGAPFELFESLFDDVAARERLMLVDTCESGERDEEAGATGNIGPMRARGSRALVLGGAAPAPLRSGSVHADRERFIYSDMLRRTGTIVFSSSRGHERSYEHDAWQNGAFTAELKAALGSNVADTDGSGWVDMGELRRYVSNAVARRTGDRQHPTVDRENLAARLFFAVPE
jgi:WD40 repeat protein